MNRAAVPALYCIADRDALGETGLATAVRILVEEGVRWVQVRAKGASGEALRRELEACREAVTARGAHLWVDDRVDLAAATGSDGVHLGQDDLPPAAARRVLGPGTWIGRSTHGLAQAAAAAADDSVDLIAVGPIHPTRSKENPDRVVGLDLLRRVRSLTAKPIVAIGGLTAASLRGALDAGADAVAVLGAVCRGDLRDNARRLLAAAGGPE